ncbi:MAG TPA: hypothetical protein DHW64_09030 [Chitinophagaceae bacterium]|nr:hypothetical protein [Chitinophagaceae bacterium]
MDKKMYQDDEFEQFLQDEVKQHRMYPSDHVWNNIRTELHGYRSWHALTFISVFIITALTLSTVLSTQQQNVHLQPLSVPNVHTSQQQAIAANHAAHEKSRQYFNTLAPSSINTHTIAELDATNDDLLANTIDNITPGSTIINTQAPKSSIVTTKHISNIRVLNATPIVSLNTITVAETTEALNNNEAVLTAKEDAVNADAATEDKEEKYPLITENLKTASSSVSKKLSPRKLSKFGFQFYITPSTSYRRLSDEKVKDIIQPAASAALPVNAPLNQPANVNEVVRHRPAVGMEIGFAVLYNISDRLKLKTGLQLNIRHYQIETFQSSTYDRATISLINFNGIENITRYSPYNNNVGYKQTELANKVYQLSVPIGLQWQVLKGKHLGMNAEASVQPTLNLNKNVYLLSTDYRHYADGNDFVRKWNINTNVGFNLTYSSGKTIWQLGPQIRYQHLPTFSNKYPIKEYLLDYGMRIGLTKAIQ